ncbi:hypothetical protein [Corynebacterium glaucum]|uniref:hypothetical protein n=1 Tax=Corynebacterium glaucum TaxID=187491 RepID=UPI002659DFA2|nr:hypothetical protein [Corynebacterium glaucum]
MARQVEFRVGEGEVVLADVNAPLSTLIFPLLELVVLTGVAWIAIGWMDITPGIPPVVRNLVVALWALLAFLRFLLPLLRTRRRRFIVTDRRVLARGRSGSVDSIPLRQIHSVRRSRGGIDLGIYGFGSPIHFEQVGKSRQVEKVLHSRLRR